jgi:hypothetical protein
MTHFGKVWLCFGNILFDILVLKIFRKKWLHYPGKYRFWNALAKKGTFLVNDWWFENISWVWGGMDVFGRQQVFCSSHSFEVPRTGLSGMEAHVYGMVLSKSWKGWSRRVLGGLSLNCLAQFLGVIRGPESIFLNFSTRPWWLSCVWLLFEVCIMKGEAARRCLVREVYWMNEVLDPHSSDIGGHRDLKGWFWYHLI